MKVIQVQMQIKTTDQILVLQNLENQIRGLADQRSNIGLYLCTSALFYFCAEGDDRPCGRCEDERCIAQSIPPTIAPMISPHDATGSIEKLHDETGFHEQHLVMTLIRRPPNAKLNQEGGGKYKTSAMSQCPQATSIQ
jgi:hypothetical protein